MSLVDQYRKLFNASSLKHILLNYSENETGSRHPNGPVGMINRDQAQLDLYAGRTRSILTTSGHSLHTAIQYSVMAEYISLFSTSIKNIRILGKHFNQELHNGQPVLAIKNLSDTMANYAIIGPHTKVNPETGEITNRVYLNEVFDGRMIFETDPTDQNLTSPDVETYNHWKTIIGI